LEAEAVRITNTIITKGIGVVSPDGLLIYFGQDRVFYMMNGDAFKMTFSLDMGYA